MTALQSTRNTFPRRRFSVSVIALAMLLSGNAASGDEGIYKAFGDCGDILIQSRSLQDAQRKMREIHYCSMEMAFRLSRNKVMDVQFSEVDLLALFDVLLRNFPYQPAMEIEEARLFVDYVNDITQVAIAKGWKQKSFRHALDKRASQLNGAAKDLLHEVGNQWDTKGNLPPDLQADRVTQQLFERIPRFPK